MKLAVCAQGEGLNAKTDQRFGRCPYFVLVDPEKQNVLQTIRIDNADSPGGAGPQSAQLLSDHEVDAVITGNVGPKAEQALSAAGIMIYSGMEGTVGDAIQKFKANSLQTVSGATILEHSGFKKPEKQ